MATSADLASWKALGGRVEERKKRKCFIGPQGETFDKWSEAQKLVQSLQGPMPSGAKTDGVKSQTKKRQSQPEGKNPRKKAARVGAEEDAGPARKGTRQVNYKEDGRGVSLGKACTVKAESVPEASSEQEAHALLAGEGPTSRLHRLGEFQLHDRAGEGQPLERLDHMSEPLLISGTVFRAEGPTTKAKGQAVRSFGPVTGWRLKLDEASGNSQILLTTEAAEYTCLRPAATYKAVFEPLQQQAAIFAQIIQGLSPQLGGDAKASLDEVAARLARAKVGKAYAGPREALAMNGAFVIGQLELWDGTKGTKLTASPFAESLRQEVEAVGAWRAQDPGAGITIRDPGSNPPAPAATGPGSAEGDAGMQADLDMARRLQAQLDVQQARGPQGRRGAGQGAPYIKISEEEIADDYPMPAQYSKVEEEMDELLLMEDDAFNLDPDSLPRRL
ncbi:hypothetical protein WJX73_000556, partial [Symbiochloris irregularis]